MGKAKEIVKLRFKKLKNGEKSAYFDIYRNGVREYLWQDERLLPELDEVTKENNQKLMLLFEERRRSLIAEMTIDKSGIANRAFNTDITLLQWLDIYEIEHSISSIWGEKRSFAFFNSFSVKALLRVVFSDSIIFATQTSNDGRICIGKFISSEKDSAMPISFNSLSIEIITSIFIIFIFIIVHVLVV